MMEFRDGNGKYELVDRGTVIGVSVYRDSGNRRLFTHTEIDSEYAGKGLASQLVKFALDDVRAKGKRVVAICPLVVSFIAKNPDYADLVDEIRGVD
ncbi:GNAT family N-acetyltransferase [Glaciihabitans tibetensis]|nr:GNAT family N-acetyltransferase [Glaciihabitans tibetensis]